MNSAAAEQPVRSIDKVMDKEELKRRSLEYHAQGRPGKITVIPTKPCVTGDDLSCAYTPGVALPCLEIKNNPRDVWKYTARRNLVAVVSDGTAVLGLGNIGPEAGLPVMEGKAVLFKHFADIDAFPICLGNVFTPEGKTDPEKVIETVRRLEPTFGGINLEDIAAPGCFKVESELKKSMGIPVFHDDQHGTAIISLAAILNALKLLGRKIENCRFVVNGAGAAGIACTRFYLTAGARKENIIMCDSRGVIHTGRTDLNPQKQEFARDTDCRTLADALKGADIFLGFSAPNCVTQEMVRSMNSKPIIFAMANPVPEIYPEDAFAAGAVLVGTGRSDFPNQINNVLGFPGIFRGALDVVASDINEEMKLAAAGALAELASEPASPEVVAELSAAYPADAARGLFAETGKLKLDMVIPKPFDPRVVPRVARRVAEAAMRSGVATQPIADFDAYEKSVAERIKKANSK